MTGSASDPLDWQPHIRNKARREALAERFKDPDDPFQLVIVRDMWLTGFDAPCLHTMYVDKPMRGHGLMQAIARVNRVFKDKPGGLVVDYLGLADQLKQALADYTESGGTRPDAIDQEEAVARDVEKYEVCRGAFHGFDYSALVHGDARRSGCRVLPAAQEHVLAQEDGKERLLPGRSPSCRRPSRWRCPHDEALRDPRRRRLLPGGPRGAGQVHAGRAQDAPTSSTTRSARSSRRPSSPTRSSTSSPRPGSKKPDISILSDEFLAEVRGMPQKNLAVELLRKLLNDEIKARVATNVVQSRRSRRCWSKRIAVPEPGDRDGPGHRGADRARQGDAGRAARAAKSSA